MKNILGFFQKVFSHIRRFYKFLAFQWQKTFQKSVFLQKASSIFWKVFPIVFEQTQLFCVYVLFYFNFLELFISRAKGYVFPYFFSEFLKLNIKLLDIPFFVFLCNPENTFFLHLIITQIVMQRKKFFFTDLVRFHIVTLTLLDSLDRLAIDYIYFFISRHAVRRLRSKIATSVTMNLFGITVVLYLYSYICGILGKYPNLPFPFDIITKSSYFWLRIKKENQKVVRKTKNIKNA